MLEDSDDRRTKSWARHIKSRLAGVKGAKWLSEGDESTFVAGGSGSGLATPTKRPIVLEQICARARVWREKLATSAGLRVAQAVELGGTPITSRKDLTAGSKAPLVPDR